MELLAQLEINLYNMDENAETQPVEEIIGTAEEAAPEAPAEEAVVEEVVAESVAE